MFKKVRIIDSSGQVRTTLNDFLIVSVSTKECGGRLTVTERVLGVETQRFYLGEHDRVETQTHTGCLVTLFVIIIVPGLGLLCRLSGS